MNLLKTLFILLLIFSPVISFSQVKLTDATFENEAESPFEYCLEEGFYGASIPITNDITKYDRITVCVYIKGEEDSDFEYRNYIWYDGTGGKRYDKFGCLDFFPTSKGFKDKYSGLSTLDVIIYGVYDKKYKILSAIENCNDLRYVGLQDKEFKVVVNGFFKDGSESYMSNGVLKTKDLYKFSKQVYESKVFTFHLNSYGKQKWKEAEERQERHNKVIAENSISRTIPLVGTLYPREEILSAYKKIYFELKKKKDFETLTTIQEKLLNLGNNWKGLKKQLKDKSDIKEMQSIILEY